MNQEMSLGVEGKLKWSESEFPRGRRNENIERVLSSTSAQEDFFLEECQALEQEVPGWNFFRAVLVID